MIAKYDDHTEIMIREADRFTDAGSYKCTMTNNYGEDDVIIKVDIIGRPDAPERPIQYGDKTANSVKLISSSVSTMVAPSSPTMSSNIDALAAFEQ